MSTVMEGMVYAKAMRADEFDRICEKLVKGTQVRIKLTREKEQAGALHNYQIVAQGGRLVLTVNGEQQSYSYRVIRQIELIEPTEMAEPPATNNEGLGRRQLCSICKSLFDLDLMEYRSYSEAGSDAEVFACANCIKNYNQLTLTAELAKYYKTRRRMKDVLKSIRGESKAS